MPWYGLKKYRSRSQNVAYDHYVKRDVLWAGDRQRDGYPITVEIEITDEDIAMFSPALDKGVTIIIYHRNSAHAPIDDLTVTYRVDDLIFELECRD